MKPIFCFALSVMIAWPHIGPCADNPAADKEKQRIQAGFQDGFFVRTKDTPLFHLHINGIAQVAYQKEANDDAADDSDCAFRRARLVFNGNLFKPWLKFNVALEGASKLEDGLKPASRLLNAYVALDTTEAFGLDLPPSLFRLRFGRFKAPYGHAFRSGDAGLTFLDLPDNYTELCPTWRTGVTAEGRLLGSYLQYGIGYLTKRNAYDNPVIDNGALTLATINLNPFGTPPEFRQGDIAFSSVPKLTVGGGLYYNYNLNAADDERVGAKLEAILHYVGFSLESEFFWHQRNNSINRDLNKSLFYLQAGYFFVPDTLGIHARYGDFDVDDGEKTGNRKDREFTLGVSLHAATDKLKTKLQLDASHLYRQSHGRHDRRDYRIRLGWLIRF